MIDPRNPDYTNTPASPRRPQYGYVPADRTAAPAVSVVTPFFNTGEVFRETVESVLRQSLQQFEWIVVDDGSDDPESLALLKSLANRDSRVHVLHGGRGGVSAARNLGVRSARADYVALLDSDDLIEPTALEKWLWFLECHPQYAMVKGWLAGFGAKEFIWRQGFHSGAAILEENPLQPTSMIRRDVYLAVGGMDETIVDGLEDWDFWLRCADAGHWGDTIPEVLDWYRTRPAHGDRWKNWDGGSSQASFREQLRNRYPRLYSGGFPRLEKPNTLAYAELPGAPAFANLLARGKGARRLLLIVPHLAVGGVEGVALDLAGQLIAAHEFQVTVAGTLSSEHEWRHRFEEVTPDVFTLDTFLRQEDYPRFLSYLIRSRGVDSILISHSHLGYRLLPYLRAEFPQVRWYDYVHIDDPGWRGGGYPAYSIGYGPFLDRTVTSSRYLKAWMTERGGTADRISVVTTNIDVDVWRRDRFDADSLRRKWDLAPGVPVILFAGRLCRQKQPQVLAAAVQMVEERGLDFLGLVVGDGEDGPWLREFAERHLTKLRLLGSRSIYDLRELLAISDVFFLPSLHEGIAMALYQAMAMSVVVVAADVGGQKELVTPDCGILIPPGENDARKYADALESVLSDPVRRKEMADAARKRVVERFAIEDMGRQMAEILSGCPGSRRIDLGEAFGVFAPVYARELIEQLRVEAAAEELRQGYHRLQGELSAARAAAIPPPEKAPPPILYRSLALLYPLFAGGIHARNRRLLLRVLGHREARRQLRELFDRLFYCASNPDVPRYGPFPLLHYLFYGYREGRRPSTHFNVAAVRSRYPEPLGSESNPLLLRIAGENWTV